MSVSEGLPGEQRPIALLVFLCSGRLIWVGHGTVV
jgi:hypothetical protein